MLWSHVSSNEIAAVAQSLDENHGKVQAYILSLLPTYEDALLATSICVRDLPGQIAMPPTHPAARNSLRQAALEMRGGPAPEGARNKLSGNLPIRTAETLDSISLARRTLTPAQRALLKKNFYGAENARPQNERHEDPYVLEVSPTLDDTLPIITGHMLIAAVDWDDGLPNFFLTNFPMLWDTGAARTYITDDILSEELKNYFHYDPIHSEYRKEVRVGDPNVLRLPDEACDPKVFRMTDVQVGICSFRTPSWKLRLLHPSCRSIAFQTGDLA
ncbi:hypothetical protein N7495_009216 [Penicillium taxi]|uniref:uncharacterized protein n=1 Tax=Penicillium taxi TaxID=168475 RepID=UPI00254512D6|nr:uncharacterized protein N7495_009216 [Penicillium taxi]KAJ5884706.1 hypothetical protein N7495_009216 [Penicillium taxi]